MPYINQTHGLDKATFVEPRVDGYLSTITVKTKRSDVRLGSSSVAMVSLSALFTDPLVVTECGSVCPVGVLNETARVELNVRRGDVAKITALRAEVNRVLDTWITEFHAASGVLPPASATFDDSVAP